MEIVPGNGSVTISDSIAISHAVPEPGTLIFCAGAAVGGCLMRWRRRGTRRGTVEM
jgi:PEP-CTERM motif